MSPKITTTYANANIALVKYWGKSDGQLNIPAVSSLSMTLNEYGSTVSVARAPYCHLVFIDACVAPLDVSLRVHGYLEQVRGLYPFEGFLEISSKSSVPMGAGLASSASFYAALAQALNDFFGFALSKQDISLLARIGSASAARSIFDNFAGLHGGDIGHKSAYAYPVIPHADLNLVMLIALVDQRKKAISSRDAMNLTQKTSPFFISFVNSHHEDMAQAMTALNTGSLATLGAVMEHSTLKMFATMLTARPAINYWQPQTIALIDLILHLRKEHGPLAFFTMDAGPNVKILTTSAFLPIITSSMQQGNINVETLCTTPGRGVQSLDAPL